jgi:exodeoxyribonuclease III
MPETTWTLTSWNINGIRARETALAARLEQHPTELLHVQELKADSSQIPERFTSLATHYTFWNPSTVRAGYSGVGFFVPKSLTEMLGEPRFSIPDIDIENRLTQVEFDKLILLGAYMPRGEKAEHYPVKLDFFRAVQGYLQTLMNTGKEVAFTGDMNVGHEDIDVHHSQQKPDATGFRNDERSAITALLRAGMSDVFRSLHPKEKGLYTWWPYWKGARERNLGWRIDCTYTTEGLAEKAIDATIDTDETSSDHSPMSIVFRR